MAADYSHNTRADGLVLTASIYNADHQNHIDNMIPAKIDDYSNDIAEMRVQTDPFPGSVAQLSTNLAQELAKIRFQLDLIIGSTYWYEDPAASLADVAANITDIATNTADIATNATGIATNVTDIGTNASAIAALGLTLTAGTAAAERSLNSDGLTTQVHGFASLPSIIVCVIECTTADSNYAIGDQVSFGGWKISDDDSLSVSGIAVYADTTNIYISIREAISDLHRIPDADGGSMIDLDESDWKVVATAYKFA